MVDFPEPEAPMMSALLRPTRTPPAWRHANSRSAASTSSVARHSMNAQASSSAAGPKGGLTGTRAT